MNDMQRAVAGWAEEHWNGEYWPPLANLARLTEEVGEIARIINQAHGPKQVKSGEVQSDLELEFGDLLFVAAALANSLDIDLQAGFNAALEKYRIRDIS